MLRPFFVLSLHPQPLSSRGPRNTTGSTPSLRDFRQARSCTQSKRCRSISMSTIEYGLTKELNEVNVVETFVGNTILRRVQVGPGRREMWHLETRNEPAGNPNEIILVGRIAPANKVVSKAKSSKPKAAPDSVHEVNEESPVAEIQLDFVQDDQEDVSQACLAVFLLLLQACCFTLGYAETKSPINGENLLAFIQEESSQPLGLSYSSKEPELSDIVADNGMSILRLPKPFVLRHAILHRCIAILCIDSSTKKFLLFRRAELSWRSSGLLDMFIAGSVQSTEDSTLSAMRELSEELGMATAKIRKIDRCVLQSSRVNTVVESFVSIGDFQQNAKVTDEISSIEYMSKLQLVEFFGENENKFSEEAGLLWHRLIEMEKAKQIAFI